MDLDELIAKRTIAPDETIEYDVDKDAEVEGSGLHIVAKKIHDMQIYYDLEAESLRQYNILQSTAIPERYKPFKGSKLPVVRQAVMVSKMVVEPKIPFLKALSMGRTCGVLLSEIAAPILAGMPEAAQAEEDEIEEEEGN